MKTFKTQLVVWAFILVFTMVAMLLMATKGFTIDNITSVSIFLGVFLPCLLYLGQYKICVYFDKIDILYGLGNKKVIYKKDIQEVYLQKKAMGIILSKVITVRLKNGKEIDFNKNIFNPKVFKEFEKEIMSIKTND
jgi:hypothetical protein